MTLLGADAFVRRLNALSRVPSLLEEEWADATVPIMRGYIPRQTGETAASLRSSRQGIFGSPVVNFLDSGTRAHEEVAHGQALKWQAGGQTFFRKRIQKPQTRGQNFKTKAGQEGLSKVGKDLIVRTWNDAA